MHFEELWEMCEKLQEEGAPVLNITEELLMKVNLYKMIDGKIDTPVEERHKIKSRILGEILLTITKLSITDNINVYAALNSAYQYRAVENSVKIPKDLKLPGR